MALEGKKSYILESLQNIWFKCVPYHTNLQPLADQKIDALVENNQM